MSEPANVSELGTDLWRLCFAYPHTVAARRHAPRGYADYESYRDWLRDEFAFRCAYCLMRESWLRGPLGFQIDHCIPQVLDPTHRLDYDNLVYTCPWCNQVKASIAVPNPTEVAYGTALQTNADGHIQAGNKLGRTLVEVLRLDHPALTLQRQFVLRMVRVAEERNNVAILRRLLGFPDDLPDLVTRRPPDGNEKAEGLAATWHEKRKRGELPVVY